MSVDIGALCSTNLELVDKFCYLDDFMLNGDGDADAAVEARIWIRWNKFRFAYGPADPTATHCLLLQEIQIGFGFTFLVLAHPGSPGQNPESCKTVIV